MTTIAYRDGVLAADTLMCSGDSKLAGVTKIAQGPGGRMGGACGTAAFLGGWLAWLTGDGNRPTPVRGDNQNDCGLVIWPDGRIEVFEDGGSFVVTAPYFAMGSGRPEALGAMFAGADAETAVRAAMAHDCHSGGETTLLRQEQG